MLPPIIRLNNEESEYTPPIAINATKIVIINASIMNILATSQPLAPIALRVPISLFLDNTLVVILLNNRNIESASVTREMPRNILENSPLSIIIPLRVSIL